MFKRLGSYPNFHPMKDSRPKQRRLSWIAIPHIFSDGFSGATLTEGCCVASRPAL